MDLKSRREIVEEFKNNKKLGVKKRAIFVILPMIELSYNPSFNTYGNWLIDVNIDENKINIILTFDNDQESNEFAEIIHRVMINSDYINSDYIDDGKVIKCNFKVPREYLNDFNKFLKGEYSQFSDKYKEKLLKLYGRERSDKEDIYSFYDAFYPLDEHKKFIKDKYGFDGHWNEIKEVWAVPNIENERFYGLKELNDIYNKLNDKAR